MVQYFERIKQFWNDKERLMWDMFQEGFMDIKDSGKREQFESGMQRDTTDGKIDFTLALDGPMFQRYAEHLTKGAQKYEKRNWMQANGEAELTRFRESAMRHFMQWFRGDRDEDHAAAVWFNINGAEYVREQLEGGDVDKVEEATGLVGYGLYVPDDATDEVANDLKIEAIADELSRQIQAGDHDAIADRASVGIRSRQVTALIALLVRRGIL